MEIDCHSQRPNASFLLSLSKSHLSSSLVAMGEKLWAGIGQMATAFPLVATGVQSSDPITFYFPHSIPISPSGAFSATESVTMTPSET